MKKKLIEVFSYVVLYVGISPGICFSNSELVKKVSVSDYLQLGSTNNAIDLNGRNTPVIRNSKFKYTHSDLDNEKNKYELQFFPTGWGETSAADEMHQAMHRKMQSDLSSHLSQELSGRYKNIINLLLLRKLLKIFESQRVLSKEFSKVIGADAASNIEALFKGSLEEEQWKLIEQSARSEIRQIESKIFQTTNGNVLDESYQLPTIQDFLLKISTLKKINSDNIEEPNFFVKKMAVDYYFAEYKLEKSVGNRFIDSLGIELDQRRNESRYSFNITINLPFIGSNKLPVNKSIIKYLEANYELERYIALGLKPHANFREDLLNELKSANEFENSEPKVKLKKYIDTYSKLKGANPELILKLKLMYAKSEIESLQLNMKVLGKYIDYLESAGYLAKNPEINFLSKGWEKL